jgi:ferric-dicitrate binding protein FerR (iron transport regulator)
VADIERYFGKRIVIRGEAVGRLQFTGRVYESQVTDWVRALESIFPVEVSQPNAEEIVIQPAHRRAPHEVERLTDPP